MQSLLEFAADLTSAQRERGVTATELAEKTGLSDQSVRAMLHGVTAPRLTNAIALADALGLELVLVPKAMAEGMRASTQPRQVRTVVSDAERMLGAIPGVPAPTVTRGGR